ncbi:hypothetical protein FD22_GL001564 [Loigolactobacillus coryniformis subsp. coryniformis KCTC 3167 = DSM 20001]|uniref:Uncharacterized protein n=2 Tax=Loigolactobacillus coryniformis TaxID=1610 RepID=A0A0R1F1N0_9LACO|nr:hypothetical protein FD22_GL001564 [Loigolactobacillus coryniformis subsp. coryniformis KCTC 3167 = DSM 20001]
MKGGDHMSRESMIKYAQAARPDVALVVLKNMSDRALAGLVEIEQHRVEHEISEELVENF